MKQTLLFLILFFLFLIEGTIMQVYTPEWNGNVLPIVPHFVFIAILLMGLLKSRNQAIIYSVIFGLLVDIIYTDLLGVYLFTMTLSVYLISYLSKIFHMNLLVIFFVMILGVSLLEFQVYGIYLLIGKTVLPIKQFMEWRLPAVYILNGAFTILIFYPFRKFLATMESESLDED